MSEVLHYAAFTDRPDGGNPAGVVLDAAGLSDAEMLAIAADVGYSETAFVDGEDIRYFSPLAEVPFCGHATVATAVALAERDGPGEIRLNAPVGPVPVVTRRDDRGRLTATLTSVRPRTAELVPGDPADRGGPPDALTSVRPRTAELVPAALHEILAALRWERAELDPELPPR